MPSELMDVFMDVAAICKKVDRFLQEKPAATSPLVKVQLFQRSQELSEEVATLRSRLGSQWEKLESELKELDRKWQSGDESTRGGLTASLEELRRLFGFFERWINQVQERFVQLAL